MRLFLPGAGALAALALAACSSSTVSRPSAAAPSSPSPPSRSASAGATRCVPGAAYCDTFDDRGSGWPAENTENGQARYAGGGYRVTANHLSTVVEPAPITISKVAQNGSVQVDVDATTGHFVTPAALGISCWLHAGDLGRPSGGYTFLVDDLGAALSHPDAQGAEQQIAKADAPGVLKADGRRNHLTARCAQGKEPDGTPRADLELDVNGTVVLKASYSDSLNPADLGDRVGVAVHGHKDEVVFDNFAVRPAG